MPRLARTCSTPGGAVVACSPECNIPRGCPAKASYDAGVVAAYKGQCAQYASRKRAMDGGYS